MQIQIVKNNNKANFNIVNHYFMFIKEPIHNFYSQKQMSLEEQELIVFPSSFPGVSGYVLLNLLFSALYVIICFFVVVVLILLTIVLSVSFLVRHLYFFPSIKHFETNFDSPIYGNTMLTWTIVC